VETNIRTKGTGELLDSDNENDRSSIFSAVLSNDSASSVETAITESGHSIGIAVAIDVKVCIAQVLEQDGVVPDDELCSNGGYN
jgi:hypothetical protein